MTAVIRVQKSDEHRVPSYAEASQEVFKDSVRFLPVTPVTGRCGGSVGARGGTFAY